MKHWDLYHGESAEYGEAVQKIWGHCKQVTHYDDWINHDSTRGEHVTDAHPQCTGALEKLRWPGVMAAAGSSSAELGFDWAGLGQAQKHRRKAFSGVQYSKNYFRECEPVGFVL